MSGVTGNSKTERSEERESSEERYVAAPVPLAVSSPMKHAISLSLPPSKPHSCSGTLKLPASNSQLGKTNGEESSEVSQENKANILRSSLTESFDDGDEDETFMTVSFRRGDDANAIKFETRKTPPKADHKHPQKDPLEKCLSDKESERGKKRRDAKLVRTRSLEKERENTGLMRERKYSLDEKLAAGLAHKSWPNTASSRTNSDITEVDEQSDSEMLAGGPGVLNPSRMLAGGPRVLTPNLLVSATALNLSSRSVNEIEVNHTNVGVHKLHGSSPDLASMYGVPNLGASGILAGTPSTLASSAPVAGEFLSSNESAHLSGDLSASFRGAGSENESRAGSETSRDSANNRYAKKKRTTNWYNALTPTYKSRSEDFKRLFKDMPNDERLIVDYSCALQKDILVQGRLYLTQNWICFYANIFRWETVLTIKCKDITSMTKEKTARVIPNAIMICTKEDKFFFTSFGTREKTYMMLFRVWQNALMDQPMMAQELWQWVHISYGEELGLTSSDDDYVPPLNIEDDDAHAFDNSLTPNDIKDGDEEDLLNKVDFGMAIPQRNLHNNEVLTSSADNSLITQDVTPQSLTKSDVLTPDATSNDLPTDAGDTTEDSDHLQAEIACTGKHEHPGFLALDETFQFSVDQLFDLLFTESEFYTEFIKSRKTFDLVMAPWPDEADEEGNKSRVITYTLSLNYSFGPKVSPSTEKQTILEESRPGEMYVIDTEVVNGGVPYGDNFYVINRFCITRVSAQKSRLRVHCIIKYRGKIWGLAKTFIDKNAKEGLMENYNLMSECLRREQEKQAYTQAQPGLRKKLLRRRRAGVNIGDKSPSIKQHITPKVPLTDVKREEQLTVTQESLLKLVCIVLFLLVAVNMVLYYKLWALEGMAGHMRVPRREFLSPTESPQSAAEWAELLEQQHYLHHEEIEKWKDILTASIKLIDNMKATLQELHQSIEQKSSWKH